MPAGARVVAQRLEARRGKRRESGSALPELGSTSEHELFDIGLVHVALRDTEWGGSHRERQTDAGAAAGTPLRTSTDLALVKCGLYLHLGLIGAVTLAIGLIRLFDGGATGLSMLVLVFFGGALTVTGWQRARAVLETACDASAPEVRR
jgi:hypothetical protein